MNSQASSEIKRSSKSRTSRRFANKHEKELFYQQLFPPYDPLHHYTIYFINKVTSQQDIKNLLAIAQQTTKFLFDTESDYISNIPAILQIFFMNRVHDSSPLLIMEMNFLPASSSLLFGQIQELFHYIFRHNVHLYTWGSLIAELTPFLTYHVFSFPIMSYIHNIQIVFPKWFNDWLLRSSSFNINNQTDDMDDALVIHAPATDLALILPAQMMNDLKILKNELWSLQDAVVYMFHQYLSKRYTLRKWTIGLDTRLQDYDKCVSSTLRHKLITYAAYDVLSLAQLVLFMYNSAIPSALNCIKYSKDLGEYLLVPDINATHSLFQDTSISVTSPIAENVDYLMIVHDSNEHHQSATEEIQVVHQQSEENLVDVIIHDIPRQHKRKRSSAARQRRNKKSSLRHRSNRYNHELIRPVNMDIESAKQILRLRQVKSLNVNIVKSILYIGVKSADQKEHYEQLLPINLFV